ncbi:unnamed protein product [Bursaphelenchus xylophilus]|uniref:(pine wood nematode) hypothetical protein n=1 Tax=Bursaphelenchus xylophilus TaxID=6326 RepID=A0A1I7RZF7_BURXY|nr:unnamed protein product [Bursaphelenchus xylophilus]CAG9106461.1 unnamed protein product [Bursaphelenchus xylophilus]
MVRMKWLGAAFFIMLVINLVYGQNFETGDNSTVIGCSSHCSYKDDDLTCWNTTLGFFEHLLLAHMRHYVSVQMNIDQWNRRHQKPYNPDFDGMRERSITKLLSYLREDDVITESTVRTVITELMEQVSERSDHLISWTPHYRYEI